MGFFGGAEGAGPFKKGFGGGSLPVLGGEGGWPAAPEGVSPPPAAPPLQPLEVRQHVGIAPAAIAHLRPGIKILTLAAVVDVAVDRGRSAERLAARRIDAAAAGPRAHLLLVS